MLRVCLKFCVFLCISYLISQDQHHNMNSVLFMISSRATNTFHLALIYARILPAAGVNSFRDLISRKSLSFEEQIVS